MGALVAKLNVENRSLNLKAFQHYMSAYTVRSGKMCTFFFLFFLNNIASIYGELKVFP